MTARRSSADGRDSYYTIDLTACRAALQSAGTALHPSLSSHLPHLPVHEPGVRVADHGCCFSARGTAPGLRWPRRSWSACHPGRSKPRVRGATPNHFIPPRSASFSKRGIDISANRTKHVDEFIGQRFDTVITLCDRVREVCPTFRSRPELVHWSVPDPALESPTSRGSFAAFERTAADL